jgi:branched-chain amino acid transport system permease protein
MIALEILINSLIVASIYGLTAIGFSLIYNVSKFIHFAHGIVASSSAFIFYYLSTIFNNQNFIFSFILSVTIGGLIGLLMNILIYNQFIRKKVTDLNLLIIGLSLMIIGESVLQLINGPATRVINNIDKKLMINGLIFTNSQLFVMITCFCIFLLSYLVYYKSRLGLILRAVSSNSKTGQILGINSKLITNIAFFIGSLLAGVGGICMGLIQNISTTMGTALTLKAYTSSVIGGLLSVPAGLLGSLIVAISENLAVWFLPASFKEGIAYILLFIFLLFKPNGLWHNQA